MNRTETVPTSLGSVPPPRPEGRTRLATTETVSPKIQAYHLERLAVVYIRQSTPQQVLLHRESSRLPYGLVERAVTFGWPEDRVLVIDEDQGHSGRSAEDRPGFQRLLVEVNLDHVGLILGLQMSRLARSNKDWHHLLEVCAIFRTLLADADGLYDPNDPNDRMLLGLKGTLSEVELHALRNRLNQGRLNKARRGELFTTVPIGYVRLPSDELAMDPDEQVQSVVRLIFAKFEELRSASAVLKYLARNGIRLGLRRSNGRVPGPVEWVRPGYSTLLGMLHNPTYAGTYCLGRRTSDLRRKGPRRRGQLLLRMDEWQVLLPDAVPAYLSWEQYLANQETLRSNHTRMRRLGAARSGNALLPGLLICGYCGARMIVHYKQNNHFHYSCFRQLLAYADKPCQVIQGNPVEELVCDKVLRVLEPAALELSLRAAEDIEQERQRLHQNWEQRLERARYRTDRAARQYQAVEPENRLVARELERRWEEALTDQRRLEGDYERFGQQQPRSLTAEDRESIRGLASVIPALWDAAETTPQDRKTVVRHLIERVVVKGHERSEYVEVAIHWAGGYVSSHEVLRSVGSFDRLRDFAPFKRRVLELHAEGRRYQQIGEQLVREGFHSPLGLDYFRPEVIRMFLRRFCQEELGPPQGAYREYLGPRSRQPDWVQTHSAYLRVESKVDTCAELRGTVIAFGGPHQRLRLAAEQLTLQPLVPAERMAAAAPPSHRQLRMSSVAKANLPPYTGR